jgi:hypothetical protein
LALLLKRVRGLVPNQIQLDSAFTAPLPAFPPRLLKLMLAS